MGLAEAIDRFVDVPLAVRVEMDRRTMRVQEFLSLENGSVIKCSRPVGDNIDVYIGTSLIGRGEIVVLAGRMCVRITELRKPA